MKRNKPSISQISRSKGSKRQIMVNNDLVEYQKPIFLNIKLILENTQKDSQEQLIEEIKINNFLTKNTISTKRKLILAKLIHELKITMNFPLQSNFIYFFHDTAQIFMKCGKDPISSDVLIRPEDFINKSFIIIKAIDKGLSRSYRLIRYQNKNTNNLQTKNEGQKFQNQQKNHLSQTDKSIQKEKKKTKGGHGDERKIGLVIECVQNWLNSYKKGNISLEKAAQETKIPKKSLDDYKYHLQQGFKYKFNFNEHFDDKIGLLRDFVKKRNLQKKKKIQSLKIKIQRKYKQRKQRQQKNQLNQQQYVNQFIQ